MKKKSTLYFSTLDSLRGIAALSVCLFHFTGAVLPKFENDITRNLFSWGWLGVEIFFVISGFIIPFVLLKNNYQIKGIFGFLGKRIVRIGPPAYIAMFLTIAQYYLIDFFQLSKNDYFSLLSIKQILHNMTYTIPFTDYKWVNGVFWTLAVEFQFYIIIALTFNLILKSNFRFFISILILASCYYLPLAKSFQFLHYSSLFLMGWAVLLRADKQIENRIFFGFLILLACTAYIQLGLLPTIFGVATALAIAFVKIKSKVGEFFGKISYSIYLVHILVGSTLESILIRVIKPDTLPAKIFLLAICLASTIVLSWLFYKTVECYFMRLADKIFSRTNLIVMRPVISPSSA